MFCGYLVYDTLYSLAFFKYVGSPAFLVHHSLGLICCVIGLYFQKMAIFGMYIQASHCLPGARHVSQISITTSISQCSQPSQVLLEATTPLLHVLSCMKAMGREKTALYTIFGESLDDGFRRSNRVSQRVC